MRCFAFRGGIAALAALAAAPCAGAATLSAAPHFLSLGGRQQIVFFVGEAPPGALVSHGDGGVAVVLVPGTKVAPELIGQKFLSDIAGDDGPLRVALESDARGYARILVRGPSPGARYRAYPLPAPARLVIEIAEPTAEASPAQPIATKPPVKQGAPRVAPPGDARKARAEAGAAVLSPAGTALLAEAAARAKQSPAAQAEAAAVGKRADVAKAEQHPPAAEARRVADAAVAAAKSAPVEVAASKEVVPTAPPRSAVAPPRASAPSAALANQTTAAQAQAAPVADPSPALGGQTLAPPAAAAGAPEIAVASLGLDPHRAPALEGAGLPRAAAQPSERPAHQGSGAAEAPPAASGADTPAKGIASGAVPPSAARAATPERGVKPSVHCQWIRVAGYAFCGPDSEQPGYAKNPALQRLAAQLGRGNRAEPIAADAQDDPTLALLAADRDFILRAESNYLLPVAASYERALRQAPQGFDAARGRANLALVYYGLGFAPELASEAASAANPAAPVAAALLGDVLRDEGLADRAGAAYRKAESGGGLGACLAARGLGALALGAGDLDRARGGLAALGDVCPSAIVKDPGTELVRAQLQLAGGDAKGALAALEPLQRYLSRRERGPLVQSMGRAAQLAGDDELARRAFDLLASGQFGARMGRRGRIELAHLDAATGHVESGLRRLADLPLDQSAAVRRDLMLEVSSGALAKGDDVKALALIHDENLDPATLPVETQVRLAQGYRSMGFPEEGQRLLDHLVQHGRRPLSPLVWEEVGANALARGDAAAALAAADALHAESGSDGTAELKLRARALLAQGDAQQAAVLLSGPAAAASPAAARELRLEIAPRLATLDAKAATAMLGDALHAPDLPPLAGARKAEALRALGEAAEKSGDDALALATYQQLLADFPGEATAIGGPFRISLLTSRLQGGAAAAAAYDEAGKRSDALSRRVAVAARNYDALMKPVKAQKEGQ